MSQDAYIEQSFCQDFFCESNLDALALLMEGRQLNINKRKNEEELKYEPLAPVVHQELTIVEPEKGFVTANVDLKYPKEKVSSDPQTLYARFSESQKSNDFGSAVKNAVAFLDKYEASGMFDPNDKMYRYVANWLCTTAMSTSYEQVRKSGSDVASRYYAASSTLSLAERCANLRSITAEERHYLEEITQRAGTVKAGLDKYSNIGIDVKDWTEAKGNPSCSDVANRVAAKMGFSREDMEAFARAHGNRNPDDYFLHFVSGGDPNFNTAKWVESMRERHCDSATVWELQLGAIPYAQQWVRARHAVQAGIGEAEKLLAKSSDPGEKAAITREINALRKRVNGEAPLLEEEKFDENWMFNRLIKEIHKGPLANFEKAVDTTGEYLELASRPFKAASTVFAGEQRALGAFLGGNWDYLPEYTPDKILKAAVTSFCTGKTPPGYEQPVAELYKLLVERYGGDTESAKHKFIHGALEIGFDPVTWGATELVALKAAGEFQKVRELSSLIKLGHGLEAERAITSTESAVAKAIGNGEKEAIIRTADDAAAKTARAADDMTGRVPAYETARLGEPSRLTQELQNATVLRQDRPVMEYRPQYGNDVCADSKAVSQANRYKSGGEIREKLKDGFQTLSGDVKINADGTWIDARPSCVVDRTQDTVLRDTIKEAHARFDALKGNPEKLATELAKFSKEKLHPSGWSEDQVNAAYDAFRSQNSGRRILLGEYIDQAKNAAGAGVCQHQALLFKTLADDFGLDASLVHGIYGVKPEAGFVKTASNHAWNEVHLGGQSYIFDPRNSLFKRTNESLPMFNPARELPNGTGMLKMNEAGVKPGDRVTYEGASDWKVSHETSSEPGKIVIRHDGVKNGITAEEFRACNPGVKEPKVGSQYSLRRSTDGASDLGWIYQGRSSDGGMRFKRIDSVKREVWPSELKGTKTPEAVVNAGGAHGEKAMNFNVVKPEVESAPQVVPFERRAVRSGDPVIYRGENATLAGYDRTTGKPVIFRGEDYGEQHARTFRTMTAEERATKFDEVEINGKKLLMDKERTAVYTSVPMADGKELLTKDPRYAIWDDVAEPNHLMMYSKEQMLSRVVPPEQMSSMHGTTLSSLAREHVAQLKFQSQENIISGLRYEERTGGYINQQAVYSSMKDIVKKYEGWELVQGAVNSPLDRAGVDMMLVDKNTGKAIPIDVGQASSKTDRAATYVVEFQPEWFDNGVLIPAKAAEAREVLEGRMLELMADDTIHMDLTKTKVPSLAKSTDMQKVFQEVSDFQSSLRIQNSSSLNELAGNMELARKYCSSQLAAASKQATAAEALTDSLLGNGPTNLRARTAAEPGKPFYKLTLQDHQYVVEEQFLAKGMTNVRRTRSIDSEIRQAVNRALRDPELSINFSDSALVIAEKNRKIRALKDSISPANISKTRDRYLKLLNSY